MSENERCPLVGEDVCGAYVNGRIDVCVLPRGHGRHGESANDNTEPCPRSGCAHPRSAHSSRYVEQFVCAPCAGAVCVPFGEAEVEQSPAERIASLELELACALGRAAEAEQMEISGGELRRDLDARLAKAEAKLQRVRDWIKFSANSEGGIVAEIDRVLARDGEGS